MSKMLLGLGILALFAGVGLSFLWFTQSWTTSTAPAVVQVPTRSILVASHPLPAGMLLRLGDMMWIDLPVTEVAGADIVRGTKSETDFVGAVTRSGFAAREPLTPAKLAKPGDREFLVATLAPGYRAVSIGVDAAQSTAGLVQPGDRVDIVLMQTFAAQGPAGNNAGRMSAGEAGHMSAGETVLQNLRVIAVDQIMNPSGGPPEKGSLSPDGRMPKTITLEVTERQAAVLLVADHLGKIQLALRGQQDQDAASEQAPLVWASDVSQALGAPPVAATVPVTQEPPKTIHVIRGDKVELLCRVGGKLVTCQREEQAGAQ